MIHVQPTEEQLLERSISAAFDSVNLINELNLKETLTEEETDRKTRNQSHLEIMLAKEDFLAALTAQQLTDIQAVL
jgi:hypothetical protein